jgi:uncharacterized glyoxalase superfamily protein PhnB
VIVNTILYVADQSKSYEFYKAVLGVEAQLNVPGMTEFKLSDSHVLGLMPESGILRLLQNKIQDPKTARGIPRAELYFSVENPDDMLVKSLTAGAKLLSEMSDRNWGDRTGYVLDLDGHVLAFANLKKNQ